MGEAGQPGLELPGGAAVLPEVGGQPAGDRDGRGLPRGRRAAAGGPVPVPPAAVARHPRGRPGDGVPGAGPERRAAHGFRDCADHVEERVAVQLGARVPASRAQPCQPARDAERDGDASAHRPRQDGRVRGGGAPERAHGTRAGQRRGGAVRRRSQLAAVAAAVRRGPQGRPEGGQGAGGARPAGRGPEPAQPRGVLRQLQHQRLVDDRAQLGHGHGVPAVPGRAHVRHRHQ